MVAKYYDLNFESKRTYLGSVGYFDENEYRALRVDVSSVLADYPDAAFRVAFQRAKDTHPYEKNLGDVTLENNKLVVVLKEVDYNIAGSLRIQITFESGSVTGKSSVFLADVGDSLSSDTTDPKSPYADALAEIDEALDKIDEFISTGGGSIALDKTLTVEGKAADAKAVGDALNALEEKIPDGNATVELDTTLTQAGKAADAKAVGDALKDKAPAYSLPIATPTVLGGVKPVAATADMTQPVGVDENGALYVDAYSKATIDAILGAYITDIDTLVGGDA